MTARDPYAVLEVAPDATDDELKRAYRALARRWHPDRNKAPEAAERFKEVAAAWEVLSDPTRRRAHDLRAHRTRAGELPREFLEDVATAIERAQDWIEGNVLPHYAGRWRGLGAEMALGLWLDLDRLLPPTTLPVTGRGRRLAQRWVRAVSVAMDDAPAAWASSLRGRRERQIVIHAAHLWAHGFRDAVALDDAILRLLLVRYALVVAEGRVGAELPPFGERLDPTFEASLRAAARAADTRDLRRRAARWSIWAAVAALAVFMFVAGYNGW